MRIVIILCLFLCSCKSNFTPAPAATPQGIYQGYDSALYVHDKYTAKMFGGCLDVKLVNGQYQFFDRTLSPVNAEVYNFDYTIPTDYGIGNNPDIRNIRRAGTFTFSHNHLVVEYSVGEAGKEMSHYRFNGWR